MRTARTLPKKAFFIMILALILSACSEPSRVITQYPPYHLEISNPDEMLAQLERIPEKEPCDIAVAPIRRELVSKLGHSKKIPDSGESSLAENVRVAPLDESTVPFQGSFLSRPPKSPVRTGKWFASESSWQTLKVALEGGWADSEAPEPARSMVVSLLMNDLLRSMHGVNFGITPETIVSLKPVHAAVIACHNDPGCTTIALPAETRETADQIPMYRRLRTAVETAGTTIAKREAIAEFARRTSADVDRYLFHGAPKLKTETDRDRLMITLDLHPGVLNEPELKLLESTAEEVWKKTDVMLNLEWNSLATDLFSVLFHIELPGARPNVNRANRSINLYPGSNLRSIAHEIGHVLGFPDHYYTVWDEKECVYTQLTLDTDVMSDSITGSVTETEWKVLIESLTRSAP